MNRNRLAPSLRNELYGAIVGNNRLSRDMLRDARKLTLDERENLAHLARENSKALNIVDERDDKGNLIGPLRQVWEDFVQNGIPRGPTVGNGPMNANVMQPTLLRQIVLNEAMRAFRRRLVALSMFAHTFQDVPIYSDGGGSDWITVPYYPLATNTSVQFAYSSGYPTTSALGGTAQIQSKQILVGGAGGVSNTGNQAGSTSTTVPAGNPPTGGGRLFQPLVFTAYEIARQPWLNTARLAVMAAEQLALDIWTTIIGAWINAANFGNPVYSGPWQTLDDTALAYFQTVADQLDWPEVDRACVLDSVYHGALLQDPFLKSYLNIGSTDPIRKADLGYGYSFMIAQSPRIPQTGDAMLKGWICLPSAVLVATANIIPGPGAAKQTEIDLVVDDQTGLSFLHQRFGSPQADADAEIIECSFGSNTGELAALKRIVAAGA